MPRPDTHHPRRDARGKFVAKVRPEPSVTVAPTVLTVTPGQPFAVTVGVVNTAAVVDAFELSVLGVDPRSVVVEPPLVSLFPESGGTMTAQITLPKNFPAGRFDTFVRVGSCTERSLHTLTRLQLDVAPLPSMSLAIDPKSIVTRTDGVFGVTVHNSGNTELVLNFAGHDDENRLRYRFKFGPDPLDGSSSSSDPDRLRLPADSSATVQATVSGRRPFTGVALPRQFAITATAPGLSGKVEGSLAQRPYVARSVLLIGFVVALLALWAIVIGGAIDTIVDDTNTDVADSFESGVGAVVDGLQPPSNDAALESARDAASAAAGVPGAGDGTSGEGIDVGASATTVAPGGSPSTTPGAQPGGPNEVVPIGAPANGAVMTPSPGIAGGAALPDAAVAVNPSVPPDSIVGTLTAAADNRPIPGGTLTFEALLRANGPVDPNRTAFIAKTDEKGSFDVKEILPGHYSLRISAAGYVDVFCADVQVPAKTSDPAASCVGVRGSGAVIGAGRRSVVSLAGQQASIAGLVTAAGLPLASAIAVLSRLDRTTGTATPIALQAPVGESGRFSFVVNSSAPAGPTPLVLTPGSFEVLVEAEGYEPQRLVVELAAGQRVIGVEVKMAPSTAVPVSTKSSIAGIVTAEGNPLSGVAVVITRLDPITGTPTPVDRRTVGVDGRFSFVIDNSTTPATFEVTASAAGRITKRTVVPLTKGQNLIGLEIDLSDRPTPAPTTTAAPVTRTISGTVSNGENVEVTVSGTTVTRTVWTVSSGGYVVDGLPPGRYNVHFELAGHTPRTVIVDVTGGNQMNVDANLAPITP